MNPHLLNFATTFATPNPPCATRNSHIYASSSLVTTLGHSPHATFLKISFLGPVWSGLVRFGLVSKVADALW